MPQRQRDTCGSFEQELRRRQRLNAAAARKAAAQRAKEQKLAQRVAAARARLAEKARKIAERAAAGERRAAASERRAAEASERAKGKLTAEVTRRVKRLVAARAAVMRTGKPRAVRAGEARLTIVLPTAPLLATGAPRAVRLLVRGVGVTTIRREPRPRNKCVRVRLGGAGTLMLFG